MDANNNLSPNVSDYAGLASIGLTRGKFARLENARGTKLRVETGTVWITHHHCTDDVILKAGDTYRIAKDGLTLVTNLKGTFALVTLEPVISLPPTLGERFWKFWAGLYAADARPTTAGL